MTKVDSRVDPYEYILSPRSKLANRCLKIIYTCLVVTQQNEYKNDFKNRSLDNFPRNLRNRHFPLNAQDAKYFRPNFVKNRNSSHKSTFC